MENKKKVFLKEFHTKECLEKLSKGSNIIYVLPNGNEFEVNGVKDNGEAVNTDDKKR